MTFSNLVQLKEIITKTFQNPENLKSHQAQEAVVQCLRMLECGQLRVASPKGMDANCGEQPMVQLDSWEVHSWVKQSILLAMRLRTAETHTIQLCSANGTSHQGRIHSGSIEYNDKFDLLGGMNQKGVRAVPGAMAREGSYVARGAILMPSFINIGAYISSGTMIDTWATAGSCAQIGKNVHVAGGVGIGGVLEPENARPVLIGDNAFLGSRVVVVEGTVVGEGAVIAANVCLTASTPIYDVTTSEKRELRGAVPPNAVLVSGTRVKSFPGGDVPLQCAYIIAYRSNKTDSKVSLNDVLRETGIPV